MAFDRLQIMYEGEPCYDIVYADSFQALSKELEAFALKQRKVCIVTDSNVNKLYAEEVSGIVSKLSLQCDTFVIEAGEEHKNLASIQDLYRFLIEAHYTRADLLIALGGGVIGDMTGYAAATYLRGIDFIQIPTTLLSQVDSSIGGKTGVDFEQYKNMIGAFYMPKLVYSNISVIKDLDDRQFASGFAEVMKSALIKDFDFYVWIMENMYEIDDRDVETLKEMIYRSDVIKKNVVEKDPKEKGERALLNFGHTLGHAIEKASGFQLLHGECVALGCCAASHISYMHQLLTKEEYLEIRDMFVPFHLPITIDNMDTEEILNNVKNDKKNGNGYLKFILLKKIGKAVIDTSVTEDEMRKAVRELLLLEDEL
ncbi:MAG: 3-dehydroquinate synthase [Lachnospiraceae bacterium]|nr:3-dehydroquinate synthase [Lachnospiraceae bacterium]